MSVIIHGLDMPKYTTKAEFGIDADGNPLCMVYHENGTEPDIYDVVPLPEGHGDLIDRDAFRAENGLNAKCEHCPTNTYECQNDMIHTKMDFCGMLDDAPVIVPAEGWTDDGD